MRLIRYFCEYILIIALFSLFKILGYRIASELGCFLGKTFGPLFRSIKIIKNNLIKFDNSLTPQQIRNILKEMWGNYGRILSEYPYISSFRKGNLDKYIKFENKEKLEEIKNGKPVVFISAHFSNFELMAMAIMIDQRVSEGKKINFFDEPAYTTTIPAQFVKKFGCKIQPVHIERHNKINFKITFDEQLVFNENADINSICLELNQWLESKIKKNPSQWIWTHDRWK